MGKYFGDVRRGTVISIPWTSYTSLGGSVTRSSNGTIKVFRGITSSASTQVGITDTEDFAGITGAHVCTISMGSTTNFFVPHSDYHVYSSGESIDGQFVNVHIGSFSVENRYGGEVFVGQLQSADTAAVTLATTASATTDFYKGGRVFISHGTGQLQENDIIAYAGATKVASLARDFVTVPGSDDTVVVYPGAFPTSLSEITAAVDALDYFTTSEANSGVTVASSTVTLNANIQQINDVTLTGDGSTTSWGPV